MDDSPNSPPNFPAIRYVFIKARLDVKFPQTVLYRYYCYTYDISPATRAIYLSGQQSYLKFCSAVQHKANLAYESTLLLFVTHLDTSGLSHTTIMVYLSAICSMHVDTGQCMYSFKLAAYLMATTGPKRNTKNARYLKVTTYQTTNHSGHHK